MLGGWRVFKEEDKMVLSGINGRQETFVTAVVDRHLLFRNSGTIVASPKTDRKGLWQTEESSVLLFNQ